ncbi:Imm51 family immunity protein [Fulvivirga kasyanovii]|nr:Imm51 family immunity protein [Fulvivirga kasyanovii]
MNPYPFQISDNGQFAIIAAIESEDLYNKYYPLFEKHGYEGNGYCWEGHIIQILEKNNSGLLEHIEFDPEAGGFYAYADSKEAMEDFISLISPIFSDINKLEEYIQSADRNRIDD